MEKHSLICVLLCLFTCYPTATSQDVGICSLVYCGQGTCNSTSLTPLFECNCFPGWRKIQIGPLTFPSCLIPNCTTDLQCGNGSSPPSPPPPPLSLPNFTDPCNLVWCAEGRCMPNGTRHICECDVGAANLISDPELPCFEPCVLGADCTDLGLLPPPSPLPPPPNSGSNGSPSSSSPNSGATGRKMVNSWKNVGVLLFISLKFI